MIRQVRRRMLANGWRLGLIPFLFLSVVAGSAHAQLSISTIQLTDNSAGAITNFTVSFNTTAGIGADDTLTVTLSAGFDLTNTQIASSTTLNGGFVVLPPSGQQFRIRRDGTGTAAAGGDHNISFGVVGNSTSVFPSHSLTLQIQQSGESDSGSFDTVPAALSYFTLAGVPSSVTAGSAFSGDVTVTAFDPYGNQKTNYTGTVGWTSSDAQATPGSGLPSNYTFQPGDNGSKAFSAADFVLKTVGNQTITVAAGSISKTSGSISVGQAALSSFTLSASTPQTAGVPFSLSVTNAKDALNNDWSGSITVSLIPGNSGQSNAPDGTAPSLSDIQVQSGSGSAQQTLVRKDTNVKLEGTDGSVTQTTAAITVDAGALKSFDMAGQPSSLVAGNNFGTNNVTITARDVYRNIKTNFTGTVSWSTTDPHGGVSLPADYPFTGADQGSHTFAGTEFQLNTAGGQTITVTSGSISATSGAINVSHATLNVFTLAAPGSVTAGTGFSLAVSAAKDAFNNNWSGTVAVTTTTGGSDSPNGSTPSISNITVANGSGSAEQVLVKTEDTVFRGTADGTNASSGTVTVGPGILGSFDLSGYPSGVTAGTSFGSNDVTVTALDIFGNTKTDYATTVGFTSTDPTATLPSASTLTLGTKVFPGSQFILRTVGTQTISVTGSSKTTTSSGISVGSGNIANFTLSVAASQTAGTPFVLSATNVVDGSGNPVSGTITVTVPPGGGGGNSPNGTTPTLQNITVTNGNGSAQQTLVNAVPTTLRGTAGSVSKDTPLITVNPASLDAFSIATIANTTAGSNFTINVTGTDAYGNTASGFSGSGTISDKTGTLSPTDITITSGTGSRSVAVTRARTGNTVSVTASGKSGTSNSFDVAPAGLDSFAMTGYPTSVTAGSNFGSNNVVVTAFDQYANRKTNFTGAIYFTSTDPGAALPYTSGSKYTFTTGDSGRHTFSGTGFTLNTSGNQTLTVTNGSVSETSSTIVVSTSTIATFQLSVGSTQTAGTPFSLSVLNAKDAANNPVSGTVTVSVFSGGGASPDGSTPVLSNINVIDGSGSAQQTLFRTVPTVLRGTAGSVMVNTSSITVQPAVLGSFSTATIPSQTAGSPFTVSDTSKDLYGNTKTDFGSTATLTDLTGDLSTTMSFSAGVGSKSVTISKTRTNNTITTTSGNVSSSSNSFDVGPGALASFTFDPIDPQQAGVPFSITVTAKDAFDNVKTDFSGSVGLSVNQGSMTPTSINLTNGVGSRNVTISTSGSDYRITATSGSQTGSSNFFNVSSSAVSSFDFDPISSQATGEPFSITITAKDAFGNRVFDFTEKVDLSDLTGTLTPDSTGPFNAGVWTGNVTITQPSTGNTITASRGAVSTTSSSFDVTSTSIDHFAVTDLSNSPLADQEAGTPFGVKVVAKDANNNTVTNFTGTVEISDLTGTISPTISGNFTGGEWSSSAISITRARTANKITVTGSGRSGSSVVFDVDPGPLASFRFDDIVSPQQAGVPFSVTITAVDAFDNTVTGFTSQVSLTSTAGTVTPSTSGSFAAGAWTGTVKLVQSQTDVRLTASGGGKVGNSKFFNVNPGPLALFTISPINTQLVNEPFNITVTAKDTMNNTVTGFTGKVSISDQTGTVSPTESGSFVLGQWTGPVAISVETSNDVITVRNSSGSQQGQSNGFGVQVGPGFRIVRFEKSQQSVTAGQTRDWTLKMVVNNPSSDPVTLDSVRVQVKVNDVDITGEFTIVPYPTTFLGSGSSVLSGNDTDSLLIRIDQTGTSVGSAIVQGRMWATGVGQVSDQAIIQVAIQAPAQLVINQVVPSRTTVTRGQTQSWTVDVAVTNTGGSNVTMDFSASKTDLLFSPGVGYNWQRPNTLKSGSTVLAAGVTDTLFYTVTVTGSQTGQVTVGAKVGGTESNSGTQRSDDTSDSGAATITVQAPADVRVESVRALFNGQPITHVNTGQAFVLQVQVRNSGEEEALGVKLQFGSDGSSAWSPTSVTLASVPGNSLGSGITTITASSSPTPSEEFVARIVEAKGANTQADITPSQAADSTASVVIEMPAVLDVTSITVATDTVFAFQSNWELLVSVSNTGDAALNLDPPTAADVTFEIESQVQNDYIVEPPQSFLEGGLNLPGGTEKTLRYVVTRAGALGGNGQLTVALAGVDANDGTARTDERSLPYLVVSSASVRLTSVIVDAPNVDVSGVGFVNTGQSFGVLATVENLGQESVVNVGVSIASNGSSTLPVPASALLDSIRGSSQRTVRFDIVAAGVENLPGETFTVRVDSADAAASGGKALVRPAVDSTAVARVERPAALVTVLAVDAPDTNFTVGTTFTVRARVDNAGQAEVDNGGRLQLRVPANYRIVAPQLDQMVQDFIVGAWVTWDIQAPGDPSLDDTLTVGISQIPKDLNTLQPANLVQAEDTVRVSTLGTNLAILDFNIVSPQGARDDTVSTEQELVVRASTEISPNLRDVSATLFLPESFSFILGQADSTHALSPTAKATSWRVRAPDHSRAQDSLYVGLVGFDGVGARTDTVGALAVTTIQKANLRVDMFIETHQDNVSRAIGQRFDVTAIVFNDGTANVEGPATLRLDVGQTQITPLEGSVKDFQVNTPVTWSAFAPDTPTSFQVMSVALEATPRDINTNATAAVSRAADSLRIRTLDTGSVQVDSVRITDPAGAQDGSLSTGQRFDVTAKVSYQGAINVGVELQLPNGYFTETKTRSADASPSTVLWRVDAPDNPMPLHFLKVVITGNDENNPDVPVPADEDSIQVVVQSRARLQVGTLISDPPTAQDNIVSAGQTFTVTSTVTQTRVGEAGVTGPDSLRISVPDGFRVTGTNTQAVVSGQADWQVLAPDHQTGIQNLVVNYVSVPVDTNSDQPAELIGVPATTSLQVEKTALRISQLPPQRSASAVRGAQDVPFIGLRLEHTGSDGSNDIMLTHLQFSVWGHGGALNPRNLITRAAVVNYSDFSPIAETVDIPETNPVQVLIDPELAVGPLKPDSIAILIDIAAGADLTSFFLKLESNALAAQDEYSGFSVDLLDPSNQAFSELNSQSSSLVEADFIKAFGNYPNPFGRLSGMTRFVYFLDQASDVTIEIYTLLGELVWTATYSSAEVQGTAGLHDGDVVWDGRNGEGRRVLDGVYIARITTGAGKEATTKIAVVK